MTDKWIGPRVLCGDSNPPPDGYEYVYTASPALSRGNPADRPGFRPATRMARALRCPALRFARVEGHAGYCMHLLRARVRRG